MILITVMTVRTARGRALAPAASAVITADAHPVRPPDMTRSTVRRPPGL
jgi:hypothetical protein